jgi:hypothetical protein
LADPGDTGGPNYVGQAAWGINHACISTAPLCNDASLKDDLVYVAEDFIEGGLGVSIMTAP